MLTITVFAFIFGIHRVNLGLELLPISLGERRGILALIIIKVKRYNVLRVLVFGVAHAEHGGPYIHALELILQDITAAVATDNQRYFAVRHVIEAFYAVSSNLAHDKLEQIMGCYAFFPSSSSCSSVSG